MNKLIKNTFKFFQVIIVILMILLSGSAMFIISSFLNDEHKCCCCKKSTSHQTQESLQCNKDCCTIVEAKEQPLDGGIPVSGNNIEKTFYSCYGFLQSGNGQILASSIIFNRVNNKPQKIFLLTSVIRI